MTVTIKYLSVLRDKAGVREESVDFPPGSRLADLAGWLRERHGFEYGDGNIMFILNGRGWGQHPQGLETPLTEGDTIMLSVLVGGG